MKKRQFIGIAFLAMLLLGACGSQVEQSEQEQQVLMSGVMAVLPEQLVVDSCDETGCLFVSSDEGERAYFQTLAKPLAEASWCYPGGLMLHQAGEAFLEWQAGEIADVTLLWNHAELERPGEVVTQAAVPAYGVLVTHDLYTAATLEQAEQQTGAILTEQQTVRIWHVFLAQPDGDTVYELWLNADQYSKEQLLAMVQSMVFTEAAFTQN